jgi:hypothetical protein
MGEEGERAVRTLLRAGFEAGLTPDPGEVRVRRSPAGGTG